MADISVIKLPNGNSYNLKDTTARNAANSAVPNTRTVNGKALSSNISLGAGDVGAYTKKETDTKINAAVASTYKYKGSVTADKLPTSGQVVGDVYNITNDSSYGKAGMNVAWNGTTWDALGSNVDLSNYVTTSDSRLSNARPASDVYAWAKAAKKPSYSASEISGLGSLATKNSLSAGDVGALPTSGGTMTGDIAFAATGATGTSNKISFSGSTDGAQIYYNVPSSDQGNLIFNMTDDTNAYIQFAQNGTVHSYISPADGTYHGNISGSAGSVAWGNVSDKPSTYPPSSHTHTKAQVGLGNVANLDQSKAIKSITRSGTTFTATALDGTTTTFTQQDNNTTYGIATSSSDGLMSKTDKAKLDGIGAGSNVKSVNGKTGAVSLSKADIGLGNVDNTSDADKPYYKLIGQTETNTNKVGHFDFNDASQSLYKIKNFYAASGEGDYFYLAHKKSAYTITTTKHFSNVYLLFTADLSADCTVATNLISESDPAILTIVRNGTITATDVLTLIFYEHRAWQSNARLNHWKLEIMAAGANSPNYTKHTWKDGDWITVFERTNVSDSINRLWCGLNPYRDDGLGYLYIKGIRITIYAATPVSTKSGDFGYNLLEIAGMRLLDSRPSFSPAEALGALDVAGGTVYGKTTFQEGISATSYSGATATSSADGLMSKSDKSKLDGIGAGSNVKSVNSKTGAVTLTKSDIGLSNVDNTADSAKSVKYAASAGSANAVAWSNVSGKPSTYPPSSHTHTPAQVGLGSVANLDQSKAIKSITRSGTTFTATALDGTTTTFTQQDSNTTYGVATSSTDGLMSKSDKSKLDGIGAGSNVKSVNGKTGAVTLAKGDVGLGSVANYDQSKAIKSITRNGTTFTATALDGTTSTFTQQDTNTTYGLASQSSNGLMSAADKKAVDREFFRMLPKGGTHIPANADLNSTEYIKVGNYYNSADVESKTIKNIPVNSAFMMYVLSPLSEVYDNESSGQWVYRLRIFVTYTGNIYTQLVSSGSTKGVFTYQPWSKLATNKSDVGLSNVANYDQSKAIKSITRSGTTFTATALDGTTTTFTQQDSNTTYGVATSSANGLMSKADKAKLDGIGAESNVKSVNGKTGAVTLAKGDVGLGNVDNTADSAKSVKYAASAGSANSVAWSNVSGRPSSLPANGGNSATVNGHTVNANVPSGAKFTDTTYSVATQSANGLMSAADKKKLDSYTTRSAGGAVEVTLAAASWSSSTTEINGNNYYTYSVSVANIGNPHPQIFCSGGDSIIPSATQENEFNHIKYALVDTAKSTVTFYSIEKPSVAINVVIKDYLESSIVSGTASVTIATSDWSSTTSTVNGKAFYTAKKTLSSVSSDYPTIICGTADTLPSDAEQTAFDCINYAAADTSTKTVTFYAIQKPTSAVVAIVI